MDNKNQINKIDCPICKKRFFNIQIGSHFCDLCGSSFVVDEHKQVFNLNKNYRYIIFNGALKYIGLITGVVAYVFGAFFKGQYELLEKSFLSIFCISASLFIFIRCIQAFKHGLINTRSLAEPMVYIKETPGQFLGWFFIYILIGLIVLFVFISEFG